MIELPHKKRLQHRIENEDRAFIQIIVGPRQVGKTTIAHQIIDQLKFPTHFATADGVITSESTWISQQWETARFKLQQSPNEEVLLVIDEIQKIEHWSEIFKKEWDTDSQKGHTIKVLLLGSSRLLIQKGLTESLAGRFEITFVGHWTFPLMKEAFGFTFDQFTWFGGYPGAASLIEDEGRWKEYIRNSLIESSISKDILMTTRIDKPALMKRLFELGCSYSGQILSYNKILGQLLDAGNTTTLAHYLYLLDTAGLLAGIEKYSPEITRQRSSSPKFQVHNMALKSALYSGDFTEVRENQSLWGRWVESAIGTHLLNSSFGSNLNVYYWRHRNDEVDFVLTFKNKTIGIEVKSGFKNPKKGMEAFSKKYTPTKMLLVGRDGISPEEFLSVAPTEFFN